MNSSLRKVDIGLILTVLTLGGMLYKMAGKPQKWDETTQRVDRMEPVVWQNKNKVEVMDAHFNDMIRRLERIENKLDGRYRTGWKNCDEVPGCETRRG